jgi:hypothetical protein
MANNADLHPRVAVVTPSFQIAEISPRWRETWSFFLNSQKRHIPCSIML